MSTAAHPPFSLPVRVYWEDTDAGGVVYYANYLKFFERARTEWLRSAGKASVVFVQQARRGGPDGELLAEATIRVGWLQAQTMRPARMPEEIWRALQGDVSAS